MTDTLTRPSFVEVTNNGSTPLRVALNSRVSTIPPGRTAIVDREAACAAFGDWTLRDHPTDPLRKPRTKEYARVRGHYGCLPGGIYEEKYLTENGWRTRPLDVEGAWQERRPHVAISENGTQVVLVIDDPSGQSLPAEDPTNLDRDKLIAHLLTQQQQMSDMISRLEAESRSPGEQVQILEDAPDVKPAARRKPHQVVPVDEREE